MATDLRTRITDPGFTPSLRDTAAVVDLLAEGDAPDENDKNGKTVFELACKALLRLAPLGDPAWDALAKLVGDPRPRVRAGVIDVLTQIDAEKTVPLAVRALADDEAAVRRRAIAALGRKTDERGEKALLALYPTASAPHRRAIVLALGKSGEEAALIFLRTLSDDPTTAEDPELTRLVQQARARLERDEIRQTPSRIVGDRVLAAEHLPFAVTFLTRRGLEPLVVEELASRNLGLGAGRITGEGRVTIAWRGTLEGALAAARCAYGIALPLTSSTETTEATGTSGDDEAFAQSLVRALTSEEAKARLAGLTEGPVRFRLSVEGAGHKRALVWKVAGALAANPETAWLVNDTQQAPWEANVTRADPLAIDLLPRALLDERFAYREHDVPASSHPPLAAALARVAGVRAEDVVWDPFVGAGTELVERAKLGPYAKLFGSDRDAPAIAAARANVKKAGLDGIALRVTDVFAEPPPGVTVILTNPPMGRRVTGALDLSTLLDRFILHAAKVLAKPGSRLVWLSPQPRRTRTRAEAEGLTLSRALTIDMGGFDAELQRFDRL